MVIIVGYLWPGNTGGFRAKELGYNSIDSNNAAQFENEIMHALNNSIPVMNRFVHNDYHAKNVMETGLMN